MFDEIYKKIELVIEGEQKVLKKGGDIIKLNYTEKDRKDLKIRFQNKIEEHANILETYICFCEAFIGKEALLGRNKKIYPIFIKDKNMQLCKPDYIVGKILLKVFLEILKEQKHSFKKSTQNYIYMAKNDFLKNGLNIESLKIHIRCIW